jgi:electron transport complex protein RnfD
MVKHKKLIVAHAPFWHSGNRVTERSYHTILATLPAVILGIHYFGIPALRVMCLAVASAMLWELAVNLVGRRPISIGDGNAALIGVVFGMLLPATMPWWAVLTGTFIAIVIGKEIFGGIGSNAFNPAAVAIAIMMVSWKDLFDFDGMLLNYHLEFATAYPIAAAKHFGPEGILSFNLWDLFIGKQIGGIGATFGLGLVLGGVYLIIKGIIRWEIPVAFIVGIYLTAFVFHLIDPVRFVSPAFHLVSGYTLIGAFFLATEDSSSPVNFIPLLIYGAAGGIMTVLIRSVGVYVDGVIMAVLVINLIHPLLDKIRPKALGKVV